MNVSNDNCNVSAKSEIKAFRIAKKKTQYIHTASTTVNIHMRKFRPQSVCMRMHDQHRHHHRQRQQQQQQQPNHIHRFSSLGSTRCEWCGRQFSQQRNTQQVIDLSCKSRLNVQKLQWKWKVPQLYRYSSSFVCCGRMRNVSFCVLLSGLDSYTKNWSVVGMRILYAHTTT